MDSDTFPRGKPREYLYSHHLRAAGECAQEIAEIINGNLPVEGDATPKCPPHLRPAYLTEVEDRYALIERLRNPARQPFGRGRWCDDNGGIMNCDDLTVTDYRNLCATLDDLCELYGMQGESDRAGMRKRVCPVRTDWPPPVPRALLDRIEQAARRLVGVPDCADVAVIGETTPASAGVPDHSATPGDEEQGAIQPDRFAWRGATAEDLSALQWRLLAALCDKTGLRPGVPIREVAAAVYRGRTRVPADMEAAIGQLKQRAQGRLDDNGVPLLIEQVNGCLRLSPIGPQSAHKLPTRP